MLVRSKVFLPKMIVSKRSIRGHSQQLFCSCLLVMACINTASATFYEGDIAIPKAQLDKLHNSIRTAFRELHQEEGYKLPDKDYIVEVADSTDGIMIPFDTQESKWATWFTMDIECKRICFLANLIIDEMNWGIECEPVKIDFRFKVGSPREDTDFAGSGQIRPNPNPQKNPVFFWDFRIQFPYIGNHYVLRTTHGNIIDLQGNTRGTTIETPELIDNNYCVNSLQGYLHEMGKAVMLFQPDYAQDKPTPLMDAGLSKQAAVTVSELKQDKVLEAQITTEAGGGEPYRVMTDEGVDLGTVAICYQVEAVPQNSKTWYEMTNNPQFVFLLNRVRYHQGIVPEPLESIDAAAAASSAGYGVRVRRRLASHRLALMCRLLKASQPRACDVPIS